MFPDLSDYSGITCPWLTVDVLTNQISDWGNFSVTVEGNNSVKVWDHDHARHVILETPLNPFYFLRFARGAELVEWAPNA
ncbi:MAG: hypothetical protein AAFY24_01810 [Pseudomonadota bacterium]